MRHRTMCPRPLGHGRRCGLTSLALVGCIVPLTCGFAPAPVFPAALAGAAGPVRWDGGSAATGRIYGESLCRGPPLLGSRRSMPLLAQQRGEGPYLHGKAQQRERAGVLAATNDRGGGGMRRCLYVLCVQVMGGNAYASVPV